MQIQYRVRFGMANSIKTKFKSKSYIVFIE